MSASDRHPEYHNGWEDGISDANAAMREELDAANERIAELERKEADWLEAGKQITTLTRERDEALAERDYYIGRDKAGQELEDEARARVQVLTEALTDVLKPQTGDELKASVKRARDLLAQNTEPASLTWAVERWNAEVKNRPLNNIYRETLDITWRQVIRHFGGDPDALVGPQSPEPTPGHSPDLIKTLQQAAENLSERPPELRGPFKIPEHRHTFTVPEGFRAVLDKDGRATGEIEPEPKP